MSIQIVEIAQPSVIDTVAVAQPSTVAVVEVRQGPAGTGGSGSNSVTSETTSDGTADLLLLNVTTTTAEVTGTLTANHIHGNLAGNVYAHVRAGEALLKGDPVYVSGSHSSGSTLIAIISKADASNAAKMPAVGIMDADLANNATGHMVIVGTITELNTAGYSINAELYVAAGGGMTATPPTARAQPVARVERSNASNGAILVKVNGLSASDATASTLVRRDASGGANFGGTVGMNIADVVDLRFEDFQAAAGATFTYGTGAASAHRFALNGGAATGDALFTAATPAAARTTLELGSTDSPTFNRLTLGAGVIATPALTLGNVAVFNRSSGIFTVKVGTAGILEVLADQLRTGTQRISFTPTTNAGVAADCFINRTGAGAFAFGTTSGGSEASVSLTNLTASGNVGIGTTSPASKLTVTGGDAEVTDATKGLILKTPDGTKRYRVTIDNAGALTTTLL